MPKIAFHMLVFNSDFVLEPVLQTILPFGPLIVSEGPTAYWQKRGFTRSVDSTNEILEEYLHYGYGIQIVHGQWNTKTEELNASMHLIPDDTAYVWECDSDECYHPQDIQRILQILDSNLYDSISFRMWSLFGGFERYMTGFEENFEVQRIKRFYPGARWATHRPPTIINPETGRPFRERHHLSHYETDMMGLRMMHYSYCFPRQMKDKADYYFAYAPNRDIENFFDRVYLPWVLGNDEEKQRIEDEFDGIHNWKPEARGPCRTAKFTGIHPPAIKDAMPRLLAEFDAQLDSYVKYKDFDHCKVV